MKSKLLPGMKSVDIPGLGRELFRTFGVLVYPKYTQRHLAFHFLFQPIETQGANLSVHRLRSGQFEREMETTSPESGTSSAPTVGMEDVLAVENFIGGVCPYLLSAPRDEVVAALRTPDATFKLKKFASDPKSPVLFLSLAVKDDEDDAEPAGM